MLGNNFYPEHTLDYGLDLRINRNFINEIQTMHFHCSADNISLTERMIDSNLSGSESYSFLTSGQSCSIASTNNSDNGNIELIYYEEISSENPTTSILALNGNTKVNLPNNLFRIVSISHNSNNINGTVWLGLTSDTFTLGKPNTTLLGACDPNYGISRLPIIYIPPNSNSYIMGYSINSDADSSNNLRIKLYELPDNSTPSWTKEILKFNFNGSSSASSFFHMISYPALSGNTTQYFTAKRLNGLTNKECEIISHHLKTK
jgi:hypothetical protein